MAVLLLVTTLVWGTVASRRSAAERADEASRARGELLAIVAEVRHQTDQMRLVVERMDESQHNQNLVLEALLSAIARNEEIHQQLVEMHDPEAVLLPSRSRVAPPRPRAAAPPAATASPVPAPPDPGIAPASPDAPRGKRGDPCQNTGRPARCRP